MNVDEAAYVRGLPEEVRKTWKASSEKERSAMWEQDERATAYLRNVIEPMLAFQYPPRPSIPEAERKLDPHYQRLEFEAARLVDGVIETIPRTAQYFVESISEGVLLEMVYIPSGDFVMGSTDGGEAPVHSVTVPAFHLGKYEITQRQWKAVMQHNLSAHQGEDLPVENVSWLDANEFCARLSLLTGREYRLPSEAEWEYACRAGTATHYSFGDKICLRLANYWDIENEAQLKLETTTTGSFYPNDFGLYDMHGNVYELCQDTWRWDYTNAPTDGSAWLHSEAPELVVIRGGSYDYYSYNCCSAYRSETIPHYRYSGTGFRVACSVN